MAFHPLRPLKARWRPVDAEGLEHLDLRLAREGIAVDSVVIGSRGGVPYGCRYRLDLDADWAVRRLDLETTDGRMLKLRADGKGAWTDAGGDRIAALDGCIDIDLAGSPFTNTLPIRRTALAPGGPARSFRMAYVPFDTFAPVVDGQTYRCLAEGRLYRYEATDRSFAVELAVDDDGLVIDYPGLFARLDN